MKYSESDYLELISINLKRIKYYYNKCQNVTDISKLIKLIKKLEEPTYNYSQNIYSLHCFLETKYNIKDTIRKKLGYTPQQQRIIKFSKNKIIQFFIIIGNNQKHSGISFKHKFRPPCGIKGTSTCSKSNYNYLRQIFAEGNAKLNRNDKVPPIELVQTYYTNSKVNIYFDYNKDKIKLKNHNLIVACNKSYKEVTKLIYSLI